MGLTALKVIGGDYEISPAGTHNAILTRIIDLGTQVVNFNGESKKRHEVMLSWELDEERKAGGRFAVSRIYTLSLHEKSGFRQMIEGWRGKAIDSGEEFDARSMLGKPCLVNVVHNDRGYANVNSVSRLPKGMQPMEPNSELMFFDLDDPDWAVFEKLSDRLQEKIRNSPEFSKAPSLGEQKATENFVKPDALKAQAEAAAAAQGKPKFDGDFVDDDIPEF